jgi:hypothetical protein
MQVPRQLWEVLGTWWDEHFRSIFEGDRSGLVALLSGMKE